MSEPLEPNGDPPRPPYRLVIVATHPIQYFSPWFRQLALQRELDLTVIYLRQLDNAAQGVGFGMAFKWDVALLDGFTSVTVGAPTDRWRSLGWLPRLVRLLTAHRPDAVLVTGWQEPLLAAAVPISRLLGRPVLLRGEANALRQRGWFARLGHRVIMAMVSAVVVIGRSNRDFYAQASLGRLPIFEGAYFVENDRMLAMAATHAAEAGALRALDLARSETDVVFVFCGKHVAFKRPEWLVEAAGRLIAEGLPVLLRIAGLGEMTAQLKARCEALGVSAHFTGFLNQTEMWRAYVGADVFVLPSTHRETWGLVVNEAMLFGLPAIISDEVGCGPDLVVEGETGWIFAGGLDGLVDCMRRAVAQRTYLRAMGEAARERVKQHYSMEVATRGLLQAIRAVVK